jgi:ketosteroid isomerase-like protein
VAPEETVSSNTDIIRTVSAALERGDSLAIMGLVSRDVRWTVAAADETAAPWLGTYHGKRALLDLFAALGTVEFTSITERAMVANGDLVILWLQVAFTSPKGREVDMEEVQIWQLADGKVVGVDVLTDTAAVAAAFA